MRGIYTIYITRQLLPIDTLFHVCLVLFLLQFFVRLVLEPQAGLSLPAQKSLELK